MKNNYQENLTELLAQTHPELGAEHRLEFKNNFGVIAGYVDGRIFISCGKFGVALRLPSDSLEDLFNNPNVEPLRYFPKGHIKKEYAVIPERMLHDKQSIRNLIDQSVNYVLGL